MRRVTILGFALGALGVFGQECNNAENGHCPAKVFKQDTDWEDATSIYDFHALDINGSDIPLDKYRGRVAVIVNVASQCGLTASNYRQLVNLHEKYGKSQGLAILAFPCNQFAGQEPGTSQEILDFARGFDVKFDMFEKIDVNGEKAHPLWKWLKTQQGGFISNDIKWNFTKFLIDKNGKVVARYAPTTEPNAMEDDIKALF